MDSDLTDLDTDSLEDSSQCSDYSSMQSEVPYEDGAGDYSGETYDEQPATKRARADKGTVTETATAKKRSGKRKQSLGLIVTVPIDIILEIFSHLEPVDLLHLFRTNKAFHKVLSANKAVWKAARANRGGVPDCMPGMSEAEWANLLFGRDNSHCQECGEKGIFSMNFGIRRRVCPFCINEHLVCNKNFSCNLPQYDPIIMDLILSTDYAGDDYDHYHMNESTADCKLFWTHDIVSMAKELEAYLKPGAEQALEDFKQSRKKYVDFDVEHAAVCSIWSNNDDSLRLRRARELRGLNSLLFQARLVDLGHDSKDVERMFGRHHYGVLDKELTDTRWKRLIPKVERKLAELQEEWRLEKQKDTSHRRESHLLDVYQKYTQTFPQATVPHPQDFLKLGDIAEFIKSPPTGDEESDIQPCSAFVERIPELRAEYMHKIKLELTRLLALPTDVVQGTTTLQSQGIDAPDDMLMQLATSVFQCTRTRFPLITWDKVQYHQCSPRCQPQPWVPKRELLMSRSPCTFSISRRGVAAARSLLSMVGLDAQTTTATTMDDLQRRFFCSNCPPKPQNGGSYRFVMNWRQGIFHYVTDLSHKEPRWEFLSAAQLEVIQSWRTIYPQATQQVWRCNKCEVYHSNPANKAPVIDHIMGLHGVPTPAEGIDFSYDQGIIEGPPPPTKFFITPQIQKPSTVLKTQKSKPSTTSTYRCQHCNGLHRTFMLEGVKQHIKAK
ncbi:hypothetical protein CY34DRAFT_13513 [Suillus luteus UH-Slu-Lm8-n1]|uniref:F-box domain-containing protein n=1 Tax=Suillus luteus UH-Slu-Lm8-n1 TaxID=930992 RepID=A0A0D0B2M2_9AGAM|nr:hypothetical protein CY34DRAFT_13513 [Suillus luteus UH-Slu-Lm8-n1]